MRFPCTQPAKQRGAHAARALVRGKHPRPAAGQCSYGVSKRHGASVSRRPGREASWFRSAWRTQPSRRSEAPRFCRGGQGNILWAKDDTARQSPLGGANGPAGHCSAACKDKHRRGVWPPSRGGPPWRAGKRLINRPGPGPVPVRRPAARRDSTGPARGPSRCCPAPPADLNRSAAAFLPNPRNTGEMAPAAPNSQSRPDFFPGPTSGSVTHPWPPPPRPGPIARPGSSPVTRHPPPLVRSRPGPPRFTRRPSPRSRRRRCGARSPRRCAEPGPPGFHDPCRRFPGAGRRECGARCRARLRAARAGRRGRG